MRLTCLLLWVAVAGCDDDAASPATPDADLDSELDARLVDARRPDLTVDATRDGPPPDAPPPDAHRPDGAPDAAADSTPDGAVDVGRDLGPDAAVEVCGGGDEDGDGAVDEGSACPDYVVERCRAWLGFSTHAVETPAARWGECPDVERDWDGDPRCVSSRGDGLFYALPLDDDLDANDALAVALTCPDDPVGRWVQRRCQLAVIQRVADSATLPQHKLDDCPAADAQGACVRSGGDGLFHALTPVGDVDADDALGVAFQCLNEEAPARAAAVAAGVDVWLFLHYRERLDGRCLNEGYFDAVEGFGNCPAGRVDDEGRHRCAASGGDGRFQGFGVDENAGEGRDVTACSALGIALRAR